MIILRHDKFISGMRIYKSGDVLPDTASVRSLVEKGFAEIISTEKTSKPARKKESVQAQAIQPPNTVQTMQNSQQNDQGNS